MNSLRRLIRTTLIGGVLFLIPLVFVVVVFGKAFQIMKVVATPLGKLIPVESLAGFAVVEILTAFIMILCCLLAGTLARSPWGRKANEKLDTILQGKFKKNGSIVGTVSPTNRKSQETPMRLNRLGNI